MRRLTIGGVVLLAVAVFGGTAINPSMAMADEAKTAAATAAESIAASELSMVKYSAPDYPEVALRLGIEGWVDVEFIVAESGDTTNVEVVAASHDNYFRNEAVRAVSRWDFEPRTVMGHVVEQKAHTRIRFVLK